MSASDLFIQVYKKFYEQKEVLSEAPSLSQDPEKPDFDPNKAEEELQKVVSYLVGVPDVQKVTLEEIVDIIQKHYSNQPEWKDLLIEYFTWATEKNKEVLEKRENEIIDEIKNYTQKLLSEDIQGNQPQKFPSPK